MNYSDELNKIWLLVECSSLVVKIGNCLEFAGFRVSQALPEPGPVKEFLRGVEVFNPGVVILQAGYPGFDMFELCRQLKAQSPLKPVPLIIFGCENHAQNAVMAFRAGAEYYVAQTGEDYLCLVRLVEKITENRQGRA